MGIPKFSELVEDHSLSGDKIRSQIASAEGQLKHCCGHHLRAALQIDELNSKIGGQINE